MASDTGAQTFAAAETSARATVLSVCTAVINGFVAILTDDAVARLRKDSRVTNIEPDTWVVLSGDQADPLSWGLDRIDQRNLPLNLRYSYSYTGTGVTTYVIDTGIPATHADFGGRVGSGYSVVADNYGTTDCNGHGTHVSHHQAGAPAVANMSLGGARSSALDLAVQSGVSDGVVFTVAAGNSNANACQSSPAGEPLAITVGATTSADERSSFSNFGSCLDVFAPGSLIPSAWYTSTTATNTISGTSMASPHVAGVAALALKKSPGIRASLVAAWITNSATSGVVINEGVGSPNLLVYSLRSGSPSDPLSESTPTSWTTVPDSTTSTTVPSGGGDSSGGDAPATTTTTTALRLAPAVTTTMIAPVVTTTTIAPAAPIAPSGTNEVSSRLVSLILGSPIPSFALDTAIVATATKVVGNNVVLSVKAPVGATVNVYCEGVLVKTVPAAVAASIKISKTATGSNSFQIVVVDKAGKVSTSVKKKVTVAKASK